ncbi:hypothetical protein RAN3_3413 [plant metagenome]|uniref:Uncharacterized protein n=1 Tax=plant metagenome TaxID=1297885 RepID=A0A484UJY0_9ZZZZ
MDLAFCNYAHYEYLWIKKRAAPARPIYAIPEHKYLSSDCHA